MRSSAPARSIGGVRPALAGALLLACAGVSRAGVVYQSDFNDPPFTAAAIRDAEVWGLAPRSVAPVGETFLGTFGNDFALLTLDLWAGAVVTIDFDLYLIGPWHGNDPAGISVFSAQVVAGDVIVRSTFSTTGHEQSYLGGLGDPGHAAGSFAESTNSLGYDPASGSQSLADAVYRFSATTITPTSRMRVTFFATNLPEHAAWGLDNVRVSAVPAPGAMLPLAAIGLLASRRRQVPKRLRSPK